MAQLGFQLSSSSRDPGWAPATGTPHDALWQNFATGFTVRPEGGATSSNNTTGVFDSAGGNVDITGVRFASSGTLGGAAPNAPVVSIDWSSDGQAATLTLDRAWNTIKNAEVNTFTGTSLTLANWVDAWVHLDHAFGQSITLDGAKRGEVSTGAGNDRVFIGVDSNGSGWTNHFRVDTGAGDDRVEIGLASRDFSAASFTASYNAAWTTTEIFTGEGNDTVLGGGGADTAWLGSGDDNFTGRGGNDTADGGHGWDSAFFSGAMADYAITVNATLVVVRDLRANADGTDTLTDFETLHFADGTYELVVRNHAPQAVADAYAAIAGTTLVVGVAQGVLANDTDADADPLAALLVQGPAHGTLSLNADGSFSYQAAPDYSGQDSFTYAASDTVGASAPTEVRLTVAAAEPPPPAGPLATQTDSYTTREDTALTVLATSGVLGNDESVPAAMRTATLFQGPEFGTLVLGSDGGFVFTPPANWFGTTSFSYVAQGGGRSSVPTIASITVDPVNDWPEARADAYTLDEGTTLQVAAPQGILANDTDADGDVLSMALATGPAHGTLALGLDGGFTYTPTPGYYGTDSFTYTLSDGVASVTGTARFTIRDADSPTIARPDSYVGIEDRVLTVDAARGLLANDSADDGGLRAIAVTATTQFGGTAVIAADGSFVYTPAANFFGTDSFTYAARDADNDRASARVSITIADQPEEAYGIRLATLVANGHGVTFTGAATADIAGGALAGGLDVNGDGINDFAIGAVGQDSTGRANAGGVHVVFGGPALSGTVGLGSVGGTGPAGFRIIGAVAGDQAGISVALVEDMNGDGLAEIVVGAPRYDANGVTNAGGVFVVWGKAGLATVDLAQVAGGTGGFAILGAGIEDAAGNSVAAAGDVNGDGRADLVVGARLADAPGADQGAAYVVFGKSSGAAVQLANLGSQGFRITGEAADDEAGFAVEGIGDVNGDGYDDFAVGSRYNDAGAVNAGSVHVVFGRTATTEVNLASLGTGGFQVLGEQANGAAGYAIAAAGDVNNDGLDDFIIGARTATGGGASSGGAYVVFGRTATTDLALASLGQQGVRIIGETAGDFAGTAVAGRGDFNGDGFLDYVLGAPANDSGATNSGAAYIVFGTGQGGVFNLDDAANAEGGLRIRGVAANDAAGTAVVVLGDVNGDGIDDLLIGAPNADGVGANAGAVYLLFGQAEWAVL